MNVDLCFYLFVLVSLEFLHFHSHWITSQDRRNIGHLFVYFLQLIISSVERDFPSFWYKITVTKFHCHLGHKEKILVTSIRPFYSFGTLTLCDFRFQTLTYRMENTLKLFFCKIDCLVTARAENESKMTNLNLIIISVIFQTNLQVSQ